MVQVVKNDGLQKDLAVFVKLEQGVSFYWCLLMC